MSTSFESKHRPLGWSVSSIGNITTPREVPENCPIPRRPDAKQREAISALAVSTESRFNRSQLAEVLVAQTGYAPQPRQISNIINQARRASRDKVNEFGGDIHAIVASLEQKMLDEPGLTYRLKIDEDRNVTGIWWQYPQQANLARRYHDVLINDNTYGRNNSAMALNIGVVIDGYNASRNIWYGFQLVEDQGHHAWMLRCHLESAGRAPEIFVSDRDGALIAAVAEVLPTAEHIFCIHHLEGNVDTNLRRTLPPDQWATFKTEFWAVYRAVSPEEFVSKWSELTGKYPATKSYLDKELYPCRSQWAWAYTSFKFTCGIRTNGRVEVENRANQNIGGPRTSLKALFDGLNLRTQRQSMQEMVRVREVSLLSSFHTQI